MLKWALTARVLKYILTSTGYSAICRHLFCAHRNETCWKTSGVLIWGPQTAECGEVALIPSVLQNVSFKFIISGWEQKNFIGISVNVCSFIHLKIFTYEGVSKSFRTGRLELELQMVQLSATTCSRIAILWVSLVIFAAKTLFVASQRVFIVVVYFVIGSVRKLLDTPSYNQKFLIVPYLLWAVIAQSV
jgi:hypothetical protein